MTCSTTRTFFGVEPKSLAYEFANTVAYAITYFINQAGFSDFEIGFRESVVTHSRGPKMLSFDRLNDSALEFREPFAPTLGLFIAPLKTPYYEGTGALHLRESSDSNRVFLLTCTHVARPPPIHPNTGLEKKGHPRVSRFAVSNLTLSAMGSTWTITQCSGIIHCFTISLWNLSILTIFAFTFSIRAKCLFHLLVTFTDSPSLGLPIQRISVSQSLTE